MFTVLKLIGENKRSREENISNYRPTYPEAQSVLIHILLLNREAAPENGKGTGAASMLINNDH